MRVMVFGSLGLLYTLVFGLYEVDACLLHHWNSSCCGKRTLLHQDEVFWLFLGEIDSVSPDSQKHIPPAAIKTTALTILTKPNRLQPKIHASSLNPGFFAV